MKKSALDKWLGSAAALPVIEGGDAEVERDGDDLYLVCGGMRIAKRKNGRWVQFEGGPRVTDASNETLN